MNETDLQVQIHSLANHSFTDAEAEHLAGQVRRRVAQRQGRRRLTAFAAGVAVVGGIGIAALQHPAGRTPSVAAPGPWRQCGPAT